jgi:hypothetical protein
MQSQIRHDEYERRNDKLYQQKQDKGLTDPFSSEENASLSYRQQLTDFHITFRKMAKLPEEAARGEKSVVTSEQFTVMHANTHQLHLPSYSTNYQLLR